MKNSGKSKSELFPNGKRRRGQGKELAPKSARNEGRVYLSDCNKKDFERAQIIRGEEEE